MKITMKEIAKEAGVSVTTVSHIINGTKRMTDHTYNRVMDVVNKYNYIPNYSAKNLRNNSTKTAGLIVPSFPDSFVTKYTNSIALRAREMGYNLLFVNSNEDTDYEEETLKLFSSQMVDGVILAPAAKYSQPSPYDVTDIIESLPIVLISRYHDAFTNSPIIKQDDFQAGFDAGNHLLMHGHQRVGIIYAVQDISPTVDRIKGFRHALQQRGIQLEEEQIVNGEATTKGGEKAVRRLLHDQPDITGLFILNDSMSVGVISGLKEMEISIPDDVALIGFGDFPSASIIDPPITTIGLSPETMGQTAFDLLLNKISNKDYHNKVEVPTHLIQRKSCGC
ncbi:LacI family transcriptional regulator [Gracilibacillus halophilus YIM-C55.5]|uniref:LacI family transcriptional regulator n=1 Tax=Gracilibacillus halophilus YIM-C55.5 TaxID=1308866 RepID=N4W7C1_9BACI|nr:LacI family DNA-binding transcriptional regulator [Gracilibacillus halophilus]ENH96143.1 LacI family transcriptional regulator [Gracilibacillus halophilus YIM-C55.5]